jgi:O-antigen/teichoic acid export membrane protein
LPQEKKSIEGTARILRNSFAMFAASVFAKGAGLIVTIFVARYLGASSLGVYAVVLAVALLLEVMSPVGHQEVIIRAIARDRSQMLSHWVNASATTLVVSLVFGAGLIGYVRVANPSSETELAVYAVAAGVPVAGLNFVAQAVLQGVERMQYQPLATLTGRALGVVALWALLEAGAGVWSAFLSHALFHAISLVILSWHILRCAREFEVHPVFRPVVSACRATLLEATPFALQRLMTEGLQRLNIIILPLLITLAAVGQFNAATQITQAIATIIPILMLTLLPVFARSYSEDPEKSLSMAHKLLKVLLVIMFPLAFVITVTADKLILLMFGSGYEESAVALQIVIWSQVFLAADSVMKQKMIASGNERAMVWYSTLGLLANVALTVALGLLWGMIGVAVAAVLASAVLLAMNTRFVGKNIGKIELVQTSGRPFLSALLAGVVSVALIQQGLLVILPVAATAYVVFLLLFKTFTDDEVRIFKQLFHHLRARFSS